MVLRLLRLHFSLPSVWPPVLTPTYLHINTHKYTQLKIQSFFFSSNSVETGSPNGGSPSMRAQHTHCLALHSTALSAVWGSSVPQDSAGHDCCLHSESCLEAEQERSWDQREVLHGPQRLITQGRTLTLTLTGSTLSQQVNSALSQGVCGVDRYGSAWAAGLWGGLGVQ